MPFAYDPNAVREIPSLGDDYSPAYGYAGEHHTAELHLLLWLAHTNDVLQNGTPPPCRRMTEIEANYWNKCMGNVDTVRKVLKKRKAVRGPDSKPGSLMWLGMFGYLDYNAFRLFQIADMEDMLDKFETFKEVQEWRQENITFTKYLFLTSDENAFNEEVMRRYFPGLKEMINHGVVERETPSSRNVVSVSPANANAESPYNKIGPYLKEGNALRNKRLDPSRNHVLIPIPKSEDNKEGRGRCIVCCEKCIKSICDNHRLGRKTSKYCFGCGAVVCKHCHKAFHTELVPLPQCSTHHHLVNARSSRNVASPNQTQEAAPPLISRRSVAAVATPSPAQTSRTSTSSSKGQASPRRRSTKSKSADTSSLQPSPSRTHKQKKVRKNNNVNETSPSERRTTRSSQSQQKEKRSTRSRSSARCRK